MHPLKNFTSFKCFIEEVESSKDIFGRRHWDLLARLSPFGMWSQRGRLYIFKQKVFMVLSIFFFRIKLSNVVIQKSNMSLVPEHGLKLLADHASGNVEAAWHYKESAW